MARLSDRPWLADAAWHAHRYEEAADRLQFRKLTRDEHRGAIFLTDEYLGAPADAMSVARADIATGELPQAPLHFILHSAFCASTMLVRAFDLPGVSMGLKEPMLFNDLVGWSLRGAPPPAVAEALDTSLTLLARPPGSGEAVVIKPSNIVAPLIPATLQMRPGASALFLEAPLRIYLGSIARKGMDGRLWVRDLLLKLLRLGLVDLGFAPGDYFGHTDLQAAAVGWLAQHALFAKMLRANPARTRAVDSETLVARPEDAMAALGTLFGLTFDAEAASNAAFRTHSKLGTAFDAAAREAERRAGEQPFADEIEKVALWAEAVAANAGVPIELPSPLLP